MTDRRRRGRRWPRPVLLGMAAAAVGAIAWVAALPATTAVTAGQQAEGAGDHDHQHDHEASTLHDHEHSRFTGPGGQWPPQPRGATGIVQLDTGAFEDRPQVGKDRSADWAAELEQAAAAGVDRRAELVAELGQRYDLIARDDLGDTSLAVYYSLSTNQTIEARLVGETVVELQRHEPSVFQPELLNAEKEAAIEVARAHWEAAGDARIDQLQGFSILAFQPGGAYYDTRMVYVSFHIDEDARPELLTWVDLAAGRVVQSEVDR